MNRNIYESYSFYLLNQKKLNKLSVARYIRILKFLEDYSKNNLLYLSSDQITNYIESLEKFKKNYQRLQINIIINFYKWLYDTKKIKINPAESIQNIGKTEKKIDLVEEKYLKFFLQFPERNWRDIRNKLFFLIMYHTGLKVGEIILLKVDDINKPDHSIKIFDKNIKDRRIKLPTDIYMNLMIYIHQQNLKEYIFTNDKGKKLSIKHMQYLLKKYAEEIGLDTSVFTTNNIRYSAMIRFLNQGMSIEEIKYLMGYTRNEDILKIRKSSKLQEA